MIKKIKESIQKIKEDKPGQRFQNRYQRRQEESQGKFDAKKFFYFGGGILIILAGLLLIPAPGPGSLITVFGLALFAGEIEGVARFMDRAELLARAAWKELKRFWQKASMPTKLALDFSAVLCVAAAGYGAYYLTIGKNL